MKIRKGFVSNSSSSNFIIAIKDSSKLEDELLSAFRLPQGYPIYSDSLTSEIVDVIIRGIHEEPESLSDVIEALGEDSSWAKLALQGYKIYYGSIWDDDYLKTFLVNSDIYLESENAVLEQSGGY